MEGDSLFSPRSSFTAFCQNKQVIIFRLPSLQKEGSGGPAKQLGTEGTQKRVSKSDSWGLPILLSPSVRNANFYNS